jgi:hypothetical protein
MVFVLLASVALSQHPDSAADGSRFMEVLSGLHSNICDFELVCEGAIKRIDRPEERTKDAPNSDRVFQGLYAYRSIDGAAYLDLYERYRDEKRSAVHRTSVYLKGACSKTAVAADRRAERGRIAKSASSAGAFRLPCSPERFIYISKWRAMAYATKEVGFESEGWEEVDGHLAMRIKIDESPQSEPSVKNWSRYWIDMSRGGHVLKHEDYVGTNLRFRMHNVMLSEVRLPNGKDIWFPTRGVFESFLSGNDYKKNPVFRETYGVVAGTLVFSSRLGDNSTPQQREHQRLRTDAARVDEDQKRMLADADGQSKQLDASPPSRRGWDYSAIAQIGFATIGFFAFAVGFFLRRKSS